MDCAIDWTDHKTAFVSVDDMAWINKLKKLKSEHPDEVDILFTPEENDGMLVARVPKRWIKIVPPRRMSEEQRQACVERLAKMRGEKSDA